MHAVTIVDGDLRWLEHPDPEPSATELLVAVRAAGLNAADLLQRRGLYPAPPGFPQDVPGMELAGEVVTVGDRVRRFSGGDRVMAVIGGGAQAEMAVVDEQLAIEVPAQLPWPAAGGFPETFSTAYDALFTQAGLSMGERVLVTGAAGGVGTAAVQLARVAGATVVASARRAEAHAVLEELGAHAAIDPADTSHYGPYDVVLELVGAGSLGEVLGAVAVGGRVVVIGVAGGGSKLELDLLVLMGKRARISGSTLRARRPLGKAQVAEAVREHVLPLLARGELRVPLEAQIPMAKATDAYDRFAAGAKLGKIVLVND